MMDAMNSYKLIRHKRSAK